MPQLLPYTETRTSLSLSLALCVLLSWSVQACLFSLCWFHSIVLGRKRFGQQGWSRAYSFNTGDLTICANVLQVRCPLPHINLAVLRC